MSVNNKLKSLVNEAALELTGSLCPPIKIISNAIKSENNEVKLANMLNTLNGLIERSDHIEKFMYQSMNKTENKIIFEIMEQVGHEFEFNKQDSYAYLLVYVLKKLINNRDALDILEQLKMLRSSDLQTFKNLYEKKLRYNFPIDDFNDCTITLEHILASEINSLEAEKLRAAAIIVFNEETKTYKFTQSARKFYNFAITAPD